MPRFLTPLLIFAGFGFYFAFQVCPTFYFWDSAELTAAVLCNGVPHPPGFPTFLLIAEIWQRFIPADPAYALNLLSAFFAALGLALWYVVIVRILGGLDFHRPKGIAGIIALIPTILMGLSFTYGIQATRFEVYSLNFAGFAALALLALEIRRREHGFALGKIAFFALLGLMLGVHSLTIALTVPGLLLLARGEQGMKIKHIIPGLLLSLVIAFGIYVIIYLRAIGNPALNWGEPSSINGLLDYIFVREFSTSIKGGLLNHARDQITFIIGLLNRQIGIPGLLLAALGAIYFTLNSRGIGLAVLALLIFNLFSITLAADFFYENFDLHGYLLVTLAVAALYMAAGLDFIFQTVSRQFSTKAVKGVSFAGAAISVAVGLAICAGPVRDNFATADLSKVFTARNFAGEFLRDSPDSSVILTSSYNTYFILLAHQATSGRQDNRLIMNIYNWDHEWGRGQANRALALDIKTDNSRQDYYRSFVNAIVAKRPIYIEYDNSSRPLARYLYPQGLGYVLSTESRGDEQPSAADGDYLGQAVVSHDIESIRTWVLWLQCRGEYYRARGLHELADEYFAALNTAASNVDIK